MPGLRMIGIMNNVSEYKLSLPLAKNFETDESRKTTKVSKDVICAFVQRAVSMDIKSSHSYKYRENDPEVVENLLDGHPSPMGQGPFIAGIDRDLAPHTVFRHSSDQECVEWDPVEKKDWVVKFNLNPALYMNFQGPASLLDMSLMYTCQDGRCLVHCCCAVCMDKRVNCRNICKTTICKNCSSQCSEHKIKFERLFNVKTDQFTLVTSRLDAYRYAVPHAGIPLDCHQCQQDLLDHQTLHVVYHMRCKFCRSASRPYETKIGGLSVHYMDREKEIKRREDICCQYCFNIFSDKYARIRHEKTEHEKSETKKFQCPDCEKCYSNINAYNHHTETKHKDHSSKKFTCEICRDQFPSKTILADHRKSIHDGGPEIESCSFNCKVCEKKFNNKPSMLRHKREVHLITSKYLEFAGSESFGYKCERCDKKFERKEYLKRHVSTVHMESQDQKIVCDQCNKLFGRVDSLKRHMKNHHVLKE